ncbi:MAG: FAD-dependent oxidoreductase [Anaerolineae bacterium]|nr:FAD-dependent oxidoreductase [Anaerolineae bacterium]CAG1011375.1 15-cis-phytoene desaturase [Anaerolineae bacterium]
MRKRVIIIGTGIAGMTAAYLLHRAYDILVFEQNDYIGGHTATKMVSEGDRMIPVDTGFIVYNPPAYPGLMRLFEELNVPSQLTWMSFSVSDQSSGFEYGSKTLNNTFAQRRNVINPRFWRFIVDYFRFNREATAALDDPHYAEYTLGQFVKEKKYSPFLIRQFIIPATSAIWSSPYKFTLEYPIQALFRFYRNHGMLGSERIRWRTVVGGSKVYAEKITAGFRSQIHLNNGAVGVRRTDAGVVVKLQDGSECEADQVVLATHSDQALKMLLDATPAEREILGDIGYQPNDVVLHTDERFMPRNKRAWESWNYLLYADESQDCPATMTYWMNMLQNLEAQGARKNYFVTLNPQREIDPAKLIGRYVYAHPLYDLKAIKAQKRLPEINGVDRLHFCGAWCRHGFHEDGLQSGLTVATNLGVQW